MESIEAIAAKMDGLGLWEKLLPYNWAVKPKGTVFPYFCTVLKGEVPGLKVRLLMLEGWQTMHDYVLTRADRAFGFYSSPIEFPHYELVIAENGDAKLFRYDTGYMPVEATEKQREFAAKILWQSYGLMMRMESENDLPMKFAAEKAVFGRVEGAKGKWEDAPLVIPDPRPHIEQVTFAKADVDKAKDLPFVKEFSIDLDFRLLPNVMTREERARTVYQLCMMDSASGLMLVDSRASIMKEVGLRGLWESMPQQVLKEFPRLGRVPGEIRVKSPRVFRMLRSLCMELPLKLSIHDELPNLRLKGPDCHG